MELYNAYTIPTIVVLAIVAVIWYFHVQVTTTVDQHPLLCGAKLKKLTGSSPTKLRLKRASELFEQGWKILVGRRPLESLEFFAKAVELDSSACGWKYKLQDKMEMVGHLFMLPLHKSGEDNYHALVTEAYFVTVLFTVLNLYKKPQENVEGDFRIVQSRLATCVKVQPENPVVYKLRADWSQQFGDLADKEAVYQDYKKAISLLESSSKQEANLIPLHGLSVADQRSHLLAHCHYHCGGILHRRKKLAEAKEHYSKAVEEADDDWSHLPDACFSLCILILLTANEEDDMSETVIKALEPYKRGILSEKRVLRYLPVSGGEVSRKLAKYLIQQHSAEAQAVQRQQQEVEKQQQKAKVQAAKEKKKAGEGVKKEAGEKKND